MRNLDATIRVSNYVRLNPGLQRARPLWSGASDKLIMPILPPQRKFMQLSMAEVARKLPSNIYNNLPRQTWILITRSQFLIVLKLCITQMRAFDGAIFMLWLNDRHLLKVF